MTLFQGDLGNPIHGVSRQPDSRKFKGQCREQINCRNNVTKGMDSRAGFELVGLLIPDPIASGAKLDNAKWEVNKRGDGKNFLVAYDATRPAVFDLTAAVNIQGYVPRMQFSFVGKAEEYYHGKGEDLLVEPNRQLCASNVLDTTFVSHRGVIPKGSNADDEIVTPPEYTWIEFKTMAAGGQIDIELAGMSGNNRYTFKVFDGFVAVSSEGDPDRAQAGRTEEYSGSFHAKAMFDGKGSGDTGAMYPTIPAGNKWQFNNWLLLSGPAGSNVKIHEGGENIILHNSVAVDAIEKLPTAGIVDMICRVAEGTGEERNEGYFIASRSGGGTGMGLVTWGETTAPKKGSGTGSIGKFDLDTMPHLLKRNSMDVFTLEVYDWKERQVGDANTNPYPTFILNGTPIQDIGLFQNRLYLVSQETAMLSASDYYNDLWRESAFYNTAADPFEVFADTKELNIMRFSSLFDGDLILFSENGQFSMSGEITHTYETSVINTVSSYQSDLLADPVSAGDNMFFATNYGNFAGVRELYTDGNSGTKRSRPVTDHVNDYMKGRIRHMASSTNLDAMFCLLQEDKSKAYLFEWRWHGNERQQQAWSAWTLPQTETDKFEFEWMDFVDATLYAVVRHTDRDGDVSFQLWKTNWDDPADIDGVGFSVRLDGRRKIKTTDMTYDSSSNRTKFNVAGSTDDFIFLEGPESEDAGFEVYPVRDQNDVWYLEGDKTSVSLIAGLKYDKTYELRLPQMKDSEGNSMNMDRFQLVEMLFLFAAVGEVFFTIADNRGNSRTINFNNRRVGRYNNLPSRIPYESGRWSVPIKKRQEGLSLLLHTDSYVPFTLESIEWKGTFTQRGRRV